MTAPTTAEVMGRKFGQLTVLQELPPRYYHRRMRCVCDCGKERVARLGDLLKGSTIGCGCWKRLPRGPRTA